ncbi:hypothetical protein BGX24_006366 [Mortierella sp. AD032]|nr:hypothetical protein BGX24_006366 [Mortierella sp. AD032]
MRRQEELDPNELFEHFHSPPLAHITPGHPNNYGGTHQPETQQNLYHNSDYLHQNHHGHHDGGHYDGGHYDHGGDCQDGGVDQAHSHYDPSSGGGQQAIGNDGAVGNQYTPNSGGSGDFQGVGQGMSNTGGNYDYGIGQGQNVGGDFQGVGQGVSDTGGNYDCGIGQGQSVGGIDQGHHGFYDGYSGGHDTGYGHGGNNFGGYGEGEVDPSSGYGDIGATSTGTGGIETGGGVGSQSFGLQGGAGGHAPYSIGAIPPPVPFIPNRVSVIPTNTTAQQEYALLDMTSIPAAQATSSTSYRPLDHFSSNASRSTHYSDSGAGGNNLSSPPPLPARPNSSASPHSTWGDPAQEFRPDRPLSQTSISSCTTIGPYSLQHQSIGSPIMYQDYIPPPTFTKSPSPLIASVLPITTFSSAAGVRRSMGAPQDRGPEMAAASGGHASDLSAFERRDPQTQQENDQNLDSLFNVTAPTLREPQGGV